MLLLVADDFAQWRQFVASLLKTAGWEVVSVDDGVEAVEKTRELQPDIILLDVSLPRLNGIEAAREIVRIAPWSKIIFVSVCDSLDVVTEALDAGALGYVAKVDADELPRAVETVLRGRQFVSNRLKKLVFPKRDTLADADGHIVQFHFDETSFVERASEFIAATLSTGNAAIVLLTKPHRDSVAERMRATAVDLDTCIRTGTYVALDAAQALGEFVINGWPDASRFHEKLMSHAEPALKAATARQPHIGLLGEAAALLWANGKSAAAVRVEQLANDLRKSLDARIFCAYPFTARIQEDLPTFEAICAEHSSVTWR